MPIAGDEATDRHRLVRMVRVVRGTMRFEAEVQPRFDYGRDAARRSRSSRAAAPSSPAGDQSLTVHRVGDPVLARHASGPGGPSWPGTASAITGSLDAGEVGGLVLESGAARPAAASSTPTRSRRCSRRPGDFWRDWIGRSTYRGRWREMVERSAMTLKLMTYAPTGALVAAPTAGLPEQVGGERNWDYRYTWIRDASFSVYALLGLGYTEEAEAFLALARWTACRRASASGSRPLQIMYRIDGSLRPRRGDPRPPRGLPRLDARSASATAPPTSCSSTSTARRWTRSTSPTPTACSMPHDGLGEDQRHARLAVRQLGPARRGHLGDPRRPAGLHLRPAHVLGRASTAPSGSRSARPARRPGALDGAARRDLRADHGEGLARRARGASCSTTTPTCSTPRCSTCRWSASSRPRDPMWQSTLRHGRGAGLRQPRLPLRPERVARRAARLGGHVLDLHVLVRRRARPLRPPRRGPARPSRRC